MADQPNPLRRCCKSRCQCGNNRSRSKGRSCCTKVRRWSAASGCQRHFPAASRSGFSVRLAAVDDQQGYPAIEHGCRCRPAQDAQVFARCRSGVRRHQKHHCKHAEQLGRRCSGESSLQHAKDEAAQSQPLSWIESGRDCKPPRDFFHTLSPIQGF